MALVLVVKKGDSIYVGDTEVVVTEIMSGEHFKICVKSNWADQNFEITNRMKTPILPQVTVSAGMGTTKSAKMRLDAPMNIKILREELME